jgi:hypothetical protein
LASSSIAIIRGTRADTALEPLAESSSQAIALGYVSEASKLDRAKSPTYSVGQACGTCVLARPHQEPSQLRCALVPLNTVSRTGWCKAWVAKAE